MLSLRLLSVSVFLSISCVSAADPAPALRILRDECLGCHKAGKAKGGLLLTTRDKLLTGGDSGKVLLPGKGAESLLYQMLSPGHEMHMPPKKQLSVSEMRAIRDWIDSGAAWDDRVFGELPSVKPITLSPMPSSYRPILALALAADGGRLAVACANQISLHDVTKTGRPVVGVLSGHVEAVQSLVWSADGKMIASGGFRQVRLWDVAEAKEIASISGPMIGNITGLAISPDGKTLFAADGLPGVGGFVHRLDVDKRAITATWRAHEDVIYSLTLSAKGDQLLSGSADKMARIWSAAEGKLLNSFEGHTNHVLAAVFNKDATQIATAGADKEVKVWDVKTRNQEIKLGDKKSVYSALAWTSDGKALIAVTDNGKGSIFTDLKAHRGTESSETGKEKKMAAVSQMLYCLTAAGSGQMFFAGSDDGVVQVWDRNGILLEKLQVELVRPH
jgi:WD40 repeat protein